MATAAIYVPASVAGGALIVWRLTAILWDHDGVLVDTERFYFQATRDILARVGVEFTVEEYRQLLLIEGRGASNRLRWGHEARAFARHILC